MTSFKKFRKMEIGTNWQGTSRLNLVCHVAKDIFTSPCA